MAKPFPEPFFASFDKLRESLLHAGVVPRHVRRYIAELKDHLADLRAEEERAGRNRIDAEAYALARLGSIDDLAKAMISQPQLQSWTARAPWPVFGIIPIILLAAAYFVACFILWSGWKVFLPASETPFVPVNGFAVPYFGIGRLLYFTAPVLVGWTLALIAMRQRLQAVWPIGACILTALIGSIAQVHAGDAGHVSMSLAFQSSDMLTHAPIFFAVSALPVLVQKFRRLRLMQD